MIFENFLIWAFFESNKRARIEKYNRYNKILYRQIDRDKTLHHLGLKCYWCTSIETGKTCIGKDHSNSDPGTPLCARYERFLKR